MVASITNKKNIILLSLLLLICTFSSRAQIVINEIKVRPELAANTPPNGLIYTGSKEYIELYNAGCSPVNVAGYYIAMRTQPFSTLIQGGTLRIPDVPAATIPAKSHIVIAPASAAPSEDIDIVITSATVPYCTYGGAGKFSIVNLDGWIALYDATGAPIDGMYWTADPNNITTLPDYVGDLCVPPGSSVSTLPNVIDIYNSDPTKMKYVGGNFVTDTILVRQVDGTGDWVRNQASSITKSSSTKNCNGGTCATATEPTFDPIGPFCLNSTAPALPSKSTNGIDGTWNPTTISTASVGTIKYTFTPDVTGCSALAKSIDIVVTSSVTPTFDPKGPFCKNAILTQPILPETSNNGINGTWNPASLSTAVAGNIEYTFTPTNTPGQCAATTKLTVVVNDNDASATLSSAPGTDNQTVPVNSAITPIVYSFTPASGTPNSQVNVTGLPEGVTYSFPTAGASSLIFTGTPTSTIGSPFTYSLTVSGNCGDPITVSGKITVSDPLCINVYNSFTPNGDGINELWKVYDINSCLKNVKVAVYNRYGSKVYESNDYKNTWDGRYKNGSVPDGTYYAVIVFTLNSGKVIEKRTDLTIVR